MMSTSISLGALVECSRTGHLSVTKELFFPFMCVAVLSACMSAPPACLCPQKPEEGIRSPILSVENMIEGSPTFMFRVIYYFVTRFVCTGGGGN